MAGAEHEAEGVRERIQKLRESLASALRDTSPFNVEQVQSLVDQAREFAGVVLDGIERGGSMKWYMLFCKDEDQSDGGAHDFHSAYPDIEEAKRKGIAHWDGREPYANSWMNIAEFDGESMRLLFELNIPGTEWADEVGDDELEWREAGK